MWKSICSFPNTRTWLKLWLICLPPCLITSVNSIALSLSEWKSLHCDVSAVPVIQHSVQGLSSHVGQSCVYSTDIKTSGRQYHISEDPLMACFISHRGHLCQIAFPFTDSDTVYWGDYKLWYKSNNLSSSEPGAGQRRLQRKVHDYIWFPSSARPVYYRLYAPLSVAVVCLASQSGI